MKCCEYGTWLCHQLSYKNIFHEEKRPSKDLRLGAKSGGGMGDGLAQHNIK
jgi:hypothetical protein